MINLKKIGLTALTGSLVAFSANAADFSGSVNGAVETTYVSSGGSAGNNLTGNNFGANSALTLSASGDVGFGTVSATRAFGDMGGIATAYQTLDMGDRGVLSFDTTGGALVGLTANDDLLPTAYEESWTGVVASDGIAGLGSVNVIGYTNTIEGVSISAGYSDLGTATGESAGSGDGAHGSAMDLYVSYAAAEGLTVGAGISQNSSTATGNNSGDKEEVLAQAVYSMGAISVGAKYAEIEQAGGSDDQDYMGASVAFNVNENFAVSYGMQEGSSGAAGTPDEDVWGVSAAYTVGAASVRLHRSESEGTGFVSNAKDEHTELGVVLAF